MATRHADRVISVALLSDAPNGSWVLASGSKDGTHQIVGRTGRDGDGQAIGLSTLLSIGALCWHTRGREVRLLIAYADGNLALIDEFELRNREKLFTVPRH